MRPLSYDQAMSCEYARRKRCRCRCGGKLHNVQRGIPFSNLPKGDPHYTEAMPISDEATAFLQSMHTTLTEE